MSSVATVSLSAQRGQSDLSLALRGTVNQLLLSVTQEVRDEIYMHHKKKKKKTVQNIWGNILGVCVCKVYGSEAKSGLTSVRDLHCSRLQSCGSGERAM